MWMPPKPVMPNKDAPKCSECIHYLKLQWPVPCLPCNGTPDRKLFRKNTVGK